MSRTLLLTIPLVALLAACGGPPPTPYESGYRYGYNDGYRPGYGDRYGSGSYGYNDRYAYGSGSPSRYRNLQRPSDY